MHKRFDPFQIFFDDKLEKKNRTKYTYTYSEENAHYKLSEVYLNDY